MGEKMKKDKISGLRTVPEGGEKCIWMEAGVIDYKLCNNYNDCHSCTFDKAMRATADKNAQARVQGLEPKGKKAQIVPWQEKMQKRTYLQRKCRHYLTGRAPFRLCPYDFECHKCQFDQMLEDSWEVQIPYRLTDIPNVDGYALPEGHFFHLGHAWARVERGGRIRIGLDDFSMKVFGPADKLDLPLSGEEVKFSETGLVFKRNGNEAEVLAPVSGVVEAVNYQAAKEPGVVKEEPYNDGWLMVLDASEMKKNLKDLLYGEQTTEWVTAEHQKLSEMVSEVGMTYADGGPIIDVVGSIPDLQWTRLTREFLRT